MAYIAFPPDGEPYEAESFAGRDKPTGLIAYGTETHRWFHRINTEADAWEQLPPEKIPAEMRAYVLLNL